MCMLCVYVCMLCVLLLQHVSALQRIQFASIIRSNTATMVLASLALLVVLIAMAVSTAEGLKGGRGCVWLGACH